MNRLRLFIPTALVILGLSACDDFFPSESSIDRVSLSPTNVFMKVGDTQQITAMAVTVGGTSSDVTETATWSSSDNSIATVSDKGLVTAVSGVGVRTATITARSGSASASTTIAVSTGTLQTIAVGPRLSVLAVGNTLQLAATGTFDDNSTQTITTLVTWASSDPNIATVDTRGLATGVMAGQATFTASANITGGSSKSGTLNVVVQ